LCIDKVVAVEYLVHWAGWYNEYDSWEYANGLDGIPDILIKDYEEKNMNTTGKKLEEMVYKYEVTKW
jgi:hypothetical protein